MHTLHCLCCRHKEKCDLYNNGEHRMYRLCSGVYLQHHNKCCDMYHLCCCLYHRKHLSIHGMHRDDEQSLFCVFFMSRWHKEKCNLYCSSKHGMYRLYSRIHI
jgi:hypothetical protein